MTTVRSRRVVVGGEVRPATIRMEEGVIVGVGDGPADHDFGDLWLMPGLVDSHVHVNEPGRTHWEGYATATAAAVAGGTTTIVDMPLNSIPPTVDRPALAAKRAAAAAQVRCDVAFWGGIVPSSNDIESLVDDGVCGFKVFTVDSGVPEFPPLGDDELTRAAREVAASGVPLLVHAEDPSLLLEPEGDVEAYHTYLATRPGAAESRAIATVASIAAGPTHILHVAGVEAVEALRVAGNLTAETCPHYLVFEAESIPDGATAFKCAPPIRGREDRETLWEALGDGTIEMIVSDHSPSPPDLKRGGFLQAWGGIASVELRLVAVWDDAHSRGHDPIDLTGWLATAPARLAGLDHRKGSIGIGWDADLVVFDPEGRTAVDAGRMWQRHPVTPYDGMTLRGEVVATFLAGSEVTADDPQPRGRLLSRGA